MAEKLGDYVLQERVARGGMGEVWRARRRDGAIVCVKRLDRSLRNDVDFIEMFRDEAALVLDLDHENIVKMFELIDSNDELAQVMEYVDGPSLARIRSCAGEHGIGISVGEALQIGVLLCRALHHAHTRTRDGVVGGALLSIVHRDVSPQNILIDKQGRLKLIDFGIAKAAQRLTRTSAGTLKGKLSYMAPEQARGDALDHRADQFAVGILVWELLTGRRLFAGRNELLILEQVQKSDAVPPSTVTAGIPRSIDDAVLRALRWHSADRWQDMASFERALQACLNHLTPSGKVDLQHVVDRTLAHTSNDSVAFAEGAPTTRVLSQEDSEAPAPVLQTHEEDTGSFFRLPTSSLPLLLSAAAVVLVAALIGSAVWFAERDPVAVTSAPPPPPFENLDVARASRATFAEILRACPAPCAKNLVPALLDDAPEMLDNLRALRLDRCLLQCNVAGAGSWASPTTEALEARLTEAAAHPCRTELLDDLLDKSPMSLEVHAALADSVELCRNDAATAGQSTAKLDAPAWPKNKQRTRAVVRARARELGERGRAVLAVGKYQRAKELLVEAVALDPTRVEDHALIGQAFRGLGDPAGAGHHLRLWLHARPDDDDGERVKRYLRRYRQQEALQLSAVPGPEESYVRAARLSDDANKEPHLAVRKLEMAAELVPGDAAVRIALGDAYVAAGRNDDAKRTFTAVLKKLSGASARQVRDRLAKLDR